MNARGSATHAFWIATRVLVASVLIASSARASMARRALIPETIQTEPDFHAQFVFSPIAQSNLISEIRNILVREIGFDPLSHRFEDRIDLKGFLNTKLKEDFRKTLEAAIRYPLLGGDIDISIDGLEYTTDASIQIGNAQADRDAIDFPITIRFSRTVAKASELIIRFWSNPRHEPKSFMDRFYVRLKNPQLRSEKLASLNVDLVARLERSSSGAIHVKISQTSLDALKEVTVDELQDELFLDYGEIELPADSGIETESFSLPLQLKGARKAIELRRKQIAELLIKPLAKQIRSVPEKVFRRGDVSFTIPSSTSMNIPCVGRVQLGVHSLGQLESQQLYVGFTATPTAKTSWVPDSSSTLPRFWNSLEYLYQLIDRNEASAAFGASDRWLNALAAQIVENCARDRLPKNLSIGPKGVQIAMDNEQVHGTLAIHARTRLKWAQSLALTRWGRAKRTQTLEFPLVLTPRLLLTSRNGKPMLKLDFSAYDRTDQTLLNGTRSIPSNLDRVQKWILDPLRSKIDQGLTNAKIDLPLPLSCTEDASGYARIESDALGRLNVLFSLDRLLNPKANEFWEELSPLLSRWLQLGPAVSSQNKGSSSKSSVPFLKERASGSKD